MRFSFSTLSYAEDGAFGHQEAGAASYTERETVDHRPPAVPWAAGKGEERGRVNAKEPHVDAENQGDRGAESCTRRHADDVRVGHGILEEPLHDGTAQPQ